MRHTQVHSTRVLFIMIIMTRAGFLSFSFLAAAILLSHSLSIVFCGFLLVLFLKNINSLILLLREKLG